MRIRWLRDWIQGMRSQEADMDKGLIKFDHIKRKLVMPDGSELPKGPGYLRPTSREVARRA